MAAPTDYVNLANGIDERASILQHVETSFYNVSQALKEVPSDQKEPIKTWSNWAKTDTAKTLIAACEAQLGLDAGGSYFSVRTGPNEYRGTYVHRYLYDHILMWASAAYAMRISHILDQYHQRANAAKDDQIALLRADVAELKQLNTEQTAKMDNQSTQIADQSAQIAEQSAQIAELLGHAKEQNVRLGDVQDDLIETKETAKAALSHLEHKSFVSTMNPQNESKHHYFVALSKTEGDVTLTKLISGQRSYVDGQIRKAAGEGFEVELEPFYNANGIDLRQNATAAFVQRRQDIIDAVNTQRALDDQVFNEGLKAEIREFNKGKPQNQKRLFRDEKQITPKLRKSDIPVSFGALKIHYVKNEYITFKEVIKIVVDANNITQTSPMSSPTVNGKKEVKAE